MPQAKGLFHRAVAQSGAHLEPRSAEAQSREVGASLLEVLEIDAGDSQKLQEVPADKLLEAQGRVGGDPLSTFWPVVDGKTVPVSPAEMIARGDVAGVPLLIGSNRDEMNLFMGPMLKQNAPIDEERVTSTIAQALAGGGPRARAADAPGLPGVTRAARATEHEPGPAQRSADRPDVPHAGDPLRRGLRAAAACHLHVLLPGRSRLRCAVR